MTTLGFEFKGLAGPSHRFSAGSTAFRFLSTGVNASVTALIVYKIFTIYKDIRGFDTSTSVQANAHGRNLNPLVSILIESGLITLVGRLIVAMLDKFTIDAYPLVECVVILYVRISYRL